MHQMAWHWHPRGCENVFFELGVGMTAGKGLVRRVLAGVGLWVLAMGLPVVTAQSTGSQSQAPTKPRSSEEIPDAPSTVQPPTAKPAAEPEAAPAHPQNATPPGSSSTSEPSSSEPAA